MTVFHRTSLLAGVCVAMFLVFVGLQGTTQEAITQPVREEPSCDDGSGRAFAPGEVIVVVEHLAAPGVGIMSTVPGGSYGRYSGTSMATPHVVGVAALIKRQERGLDDAQVKAKLLRSVDQKASL
jgi:Subtilase family